MEDRHTGLNCPYCQTPMKPGARRSVCSSCGIPHHTECWGENGGCTTFGCTNAPRSDHEYEGHAESTGTQAGPSTATRGRHRLVVAILLIAIIAAIASVTASVYVHNLAVGERRRAAEERRLAAQERRLAAEEAGRCTGRSPAGRD